MTKRSLIHRSDLAAVEPVSGTTDVFASRKNRYDFNVSGNEPRLLRLHHWAKVLVVLSTIAFMIGGVWYYYHRHGAGSMPMASENTEGTLSNEQLEAQYGVRVTLIAVTAMGGIVDFRFRVVDPDKAKILLHNQHSHPTLVALDSGLVLHPTEMGMKHHMRMKQNAVPFTFYPNVRKAIKPGTPVSVNFGDIHVGPIIAQ